MVAAVVVVAAVAMAVAVAVACDVCTFVGFCGSFMCELFLVITNARYIYNSEARSCIWLPHM